MHPQGSIPGLQMESVAPSQWAKLAKKTKTHPRPLLNWIGMWCLWCMSFSPWKQKKRLMCVLCIGVFSTSFTPFSVIYFVGLTNAQKNKRIFSKICSLDPIIFGWWSTFKILIVLCSKSAFQRAKVNFCCNIATYFTSFVHFSNPSFSIF